MEKLWLNYYQKGVPSEINPDQYQSIVEIFEQSCQATEYRDSSAFENFGVRMTYAELDQHTLAFATYLQSRLGLNKGDRLAIMLPNLLQYPVVLFGALRAGVVVVNINPLYTASELQHILEDSQANTVVVLENFAHVLEQCIANTKIKNVIVSQPGDMFPLIKAWGANLINKWIKHSVPDWNIPNTISFKETLHIGKQHTLTPVNIINTDTAFLQYTGGTTGVSKGVILSHRNIVANVMQLRAWAGPAMQHGKEIVITALPLYHIFALTVNCMTYLALNANNVLVTDPRDIKSFVKTLRNIKFTAITGVNTLFHHLLNQDAFTELDFSSLRFSIAGGMSVMRTVAQRWHAITGCPLIEGYGLTEASPVVAANPLNIEEYTGSVGMPLPSTEITIREENGEESSYESAGELWVRGPQVMQGYWNHPEDTSKVLTPDGWLKTGDVAKVDARGYITIVDRKKDMIIVSGFNVYPNEVENVIAKHSGVADVAVIGIPDVHYGELVKAYVVKKDPSVTAEDIITFCRRYLARYKIPKSIEFRDDLPKSNVGKVLRRELHTEAEARVQ